MILEGDAVARSWARVDDRVEVPITLPMLVDHGYGLTAIVERYDSHDHRLSHLLPRGVRRYVAVERLPPDDPVWDEEDKAPRCYLKAGIWQDLLWSTKRHVWFSLDAVDTGSLAAWRSIMPPAQAASLRVASDPIVLLHRPARIHR